MERRQTNPRVLIAERPRLILIALAALLYLPAFGGGYVWDDGINLLDNPNMEGLAGLISIWTDPLSSPLNHYWPVYYSFLWMQHALWGEAIHGFHAVSVLLQIGCILLYFEVVRRMAPSLAFVSALLFLVHPASSESVVWVTEQKNLLCGLFGLLSVFFFQQWMERGRPMAYALALFALAVGLLAKTTLMGLPVILGALFWMQRGRLTRNDAVRLAPFFLVSAALTLTYLYFNVGQAATTRLPQFVLAERLALAGQVFWVYVKLFLMPWLFLPVNPKWELGPVPLRFFETASVLALYLLAFFYRHRLGKPVFVALFAFAVVIFPFLKIVDEPDSTSLAFVFNHHLYIAGLALYPLLAAGLIRLLNSRLRVAGAAAMLAILLLWSFSSVRYALQFRSKKALFEYAYAGNPESWVVNSILGDEYRAEGRLQRAVELYHRASELYPANATLPLNIGHIFLDLRRFEPAEAFLRRARDLDPQNALSLQLLAEVKALQSDVPAGLELHQQVMEETSSEDRPLAHFYYANYLLNFVGTESAIGELRSLLERDPGFTPALRLLGDQLSAVGKLEEARALYLRAVESNPEDAVAHNSLGLVLMRQGQYNEALDRFTRAAELAPDDPNIRKSIEAARSLAGASPE